MRSQFRLLLTIVLALGIVAMAVTRTARAETPRAAPAAPDAAPDLIVEAIEFLDPNTELPVQPVAGVPVRIRATIKNVGDAPAQNANLRIAFYPNQPNAPAAGDATIYVFIYTLAIPAGYSISGSTDYTYASINCANKAWAYADSQSVITESNETNNTGSAGLCPPPTCSADAYEADNTCSAARWLQEGATERHTLCAPSPGTGDQDWIKFTGFAGTSYTVTASKPATSTASTRVTIYPSCSGAALTGPTANAATFTPANSGVYYARVENSAPTVDPAAAYDLSISSNSGVTDAYEPDDTCATARDIPTNGARQTHRFNKINDEDWVRFTATAGQSFIVVADNGGPNVAPVVTLATTCAQIAANQPLAHAAAVDAAGATGANVTVQGNATTTTVYYVRVRNSNGTLFGQDKTYDLRVSATSCTPDAFEQDNSSGTAKTLALAAPQPNRTACPPGDEDWVRFSLTAGKTYVLETTNLAADSDTRLSLYDPYGQLIAENDDFGYTKGSRIVYKPTQGGEYRARVRQANAIVSGPTTAYTLGLHEGFCQPDALEGATGNNGPGDAPAIQPNGTPQPSSFCADALNTSLSDHDWLTFSGVPGGQYQVETLNLGPNSDTVVELYDASGTLLASNDDRGDGRSTIVQYTMPGADVMGAAPAPLYVRIRPFNPNVVGAQTDYQVALSANVPPPPTPTPTPTPIPPAPTPTPNPATARTIFVFNKQRFAAVYSNAEANTILAKLFQAANDSEVQGAVILVETVPAIASAYAAWDAAPANQDLANAVAEAIRARLMTFLDGSSAAKAVVIVGDDRIIPYRRVPDLVPANIAGNSLETHYAADVSNGTVRAALAANMVLTDDYYVDKQLGTWEDKQKNKHPLYLPDFAVTRLIETPSEINNAINQALATRTISLSSGKVLITGYDFVQDGADLIKLLYDSDGATTEKLIAPIWTASQFRTLHINAVTSPVITSINGHSTHLAIGTADNGEVKASEILTGTTNFAGTLVYSVGCHAGLPDPALMDLPQAYVRARATYVGNTGFGWGGGGVVYTESLMRNFTREILRELRSEVGPALAAAKLRYFTTAGKQFNAFDAKVLMQTTMYGLPWIAVTSGGALDGVDPFPSADDDVTLPTSFGAIATGGFKFGMPGSFGSFGSDTTENGISYDLDGAVAFGAGEPVQPAYWARTAAPNVGKLRGAVFLSGRFTETANFNAVIALAENEYITDRSEPAYVSEDIWSPAVPFVVRNSDEISAPVDSLVFTLGQFNPGDAAATGASVGGANADVGVQRLYDQMSFSTFYSFSADDVPATLRFVDGVLDPATGKATVKVEAEDASGVTKVVVAYTTPTGGVSDWKSVELAYDAPAAIWTGQFTATTATEYFVQVVDGAGNVAVDDNKGVYYPLPAPLPFAQGTGFPGGLKVWLPVVSGRK